MAVDQYRQTPEPVVKKWGFMTFIRPLWKQGAARRIHCVAGDATGIILAAAITAALGLPMWLDLIIEYLAGFAFGLFICQFLFMKSMMGAATGRTSARRSCPSSSA